MFRLSSAIKGEPFSYKDLTHNTKEAFRRTLCKLAPVELARLELDGDDVPERLMQELDRNTRPSVGMMVGRRRGKGFARVVGCARTSLSTPLRDKHDLNHKRVHTLPRL
jgi:hypothetical protein